MSRLLLDTNLLLWLIDDPERIPLAVAATIKDPENEVIFSAASIWEIAIKSARQKLDFQIDAAEVAADAVALGFVELPVTSAAAALVSKMPRIHADPFDRLLVAQAVHLPANLLTSDSLLHRYSELVKVFQPR